MTTIFALSDDGTFIDSLKRYFRYCLKYEGINIIPFTYGKDKDPVYIYNNISQRLDSFINKDFALLLDSIAFVDFLDDEWIGNDLSELNPIISPGKYASVASMLLLSFPEVHWVFFTPYKSQICSNKQMDELFTEAHLIKSINSIENIIKIHSEQYTPLFDPTGFRTLIKDNIGRALKKKREHYLTFRANKFAAAIDEEEAYVYLHSYLAYKMGYLSLPVSTLAMMNRLFRNDKGSIAPASDPNDASEIRLDLIFEDIFLNFPDKAPETSLSNLQERDNKFRLANAEKRVFVTVGHEHYPYKKQNEAYISSLKSIGKKIRMLYKPSAGIFNILKDCGLLKHGYFNPKKYSQRELLTPPGEGGSHSAPGRILAIADKLIDRAEKIFNSAGTVKESIHGAMLALEAQELLGYRTPTTCLEAIALKHKLEVKAECMFYGVGYNIDMKNRFKEIEAEVKAVSQWFHPSVRKRSVLNGQLGILTEIVEILREYGQFDEEMQCLKRIRKLNRQFYFLNHPLLRIVQPLRAYIETLVSSFPLFIGALVFWPVFYGLLNWVCRAEYETGSDAVKTVGWYIANAFYSFFGLQPSFGPSSTSAHIISLLIVITGFLHLGIFISYLYSLIFRK
ncbi:MAG: hypothetical protein KA522_00705 [Candidatus Saccharicenans sp.]|jgi:hypothetical protein|nr:hypothetical protein [Candidatus Saccharicenans sp.]